MEYSIQAGGTTAFVQAHGAMVTAEFTVNGHTVRPLYQAPWSDYAHDPLLAHLRGDFPCVPFGIAPSSTVSFPPPWNLLNPGTTSYAHGYSSVGLWDEIEEGTFHLRYPEEDTVESITRTVTPAGGRIDIKDRIHMRREANLPLGLHPIVRLPEKPGAARLNLPPMRSARTYPVQPEETSVLVPDTRLTALNQAPMLDGESLDLTRLPLRQHTEELVGLFDVTEPVVSLDNLDEGYRVTIEWDNTYLKHCMLWISNYGRGYEPWNGRNLCLGIEPITSAFDLGQSISATSNPLSAEGLQTSVPLAGGMSYTLKHSIRVEEL